MWSLLRLQWAGMESPQHPEESVFRSHIRKRCLEQALVLSAAGIDYEVRQAAGEFLLVVDASDAEQARAELDSYDGENPHLMPIPAMARPRTLGWSGVAGYVAVLLAVTVLAQRHAWGVDWYDAGKTQAGLICDGQWWRSVTALCLHADVAHLVGNLVIGGVFGLFAGQLLGSGLAWLSIVLAGAAGNLINAWIRSPEHSSVGASTAVFAALGIVAAYAWQRRRHLQSSPLLRWAPLVGGVVLLSYLGTGGARTDVVAHVAGFFSGVALGIVHGKLGDRLVLATGVQLISAAAVLLVVTLSWSIALGTHACESP